MTRSTHPDSVSSLRTGNVEENEVDAGSLVIHELMKGYRESLTRQSPAVRATNWDANGHKGSTEV